MRFQSGITLSGHAGMISAGKKHIRHPGNKVQIYDQLSKKFLTKNFALTLRRMPVPATIE